ncbi:MAG: hypothetical protein F6K47_07585 [Symploca sp. SIO2E6]|nr:hypothetical protein [Symploca sp. SIO2E6]
MIRGEIIEQIVNHLHRLDDTALQDLLAELEGDITDTTLDIITYGADDTEHLLSSQSNAEDLHHAIAELNAQDLLVPEPKHAA